MTRTPSPLSQRIRDVLTGLSQQANDLIWVKKTPAERQALGHLVFGRAREAVDHMIFLLDHRSDVYPDLPHPAEEIRADQEAADDYLLLHRVLQAAAALALDSHVHYQSESARKTRDNAGWVTAGAEHPEQTPHLDHRRRLRLLQPVLKILRGVRRPRPGARALASIPAGPSAKASTAHDTTGETRQKEQAARSDRLTQLLGPLLGSR